MTEVGSPWGRKYHSEECIYEDQHTKYALKHLMETIHQIYIKNKLYIFILGFVGFVWITIICKVIPRTINSSLFPPSPYFYFEDWNYL